MRFLGLSLFVFVTMSLACAQPDDPFVFKTPKDWRSERIPFPLDFAKDLDFKGFEELRFAPGMFDPKSESYFTYVFLWWLEGKPAIDAKRLESDLAKYYKGLCGAVGKSRGLQLDLDKVRAKVQPSKPDESRITHQATSFFAVVDCYDAFVTGKPLTLNVEIAVWPCDASNRVVLFVCVSAKPRDHGLWKQLREVRKAFKCHK